MKSCPDLNHAGATENMFESIATCFDTAGSDNLDGRVETLVKSMNIGQRCWFDVIATNASKAIFWFNDDRFIFNN